MNNLSSHSENWHPCENFFMRYIGINYAVVILNTPINFSTNSQFIIDIWNNAKVRITVDGGTHKWLNWLRMNNIQFSSIKPPELITGDMDSLPPQVLSFFNDANTSIIHTPDQDETDFTKALRQLKKHCNIHHIDVSAAYVFGDTCGRFDQIMANINTLFKAKQVIPQVKIFQIASTSITWLLRKGKHSISIPASLRKNNEWCALIPIGAPCRVTTTGLKWNLDKGKLEFGGIVSSSNTYDGSPNVTIETDAPVIWSMGINGLL